MKVKPQDNTILRIYLDDDSVVDFDEGGKVNYGKFGGLLVEVKAVAGRKA